MALLALMRNKQVWGCRPGDSVSNRFATTALDPSVWGSSPARPVPLSLPTALSLSLQEANLFAELSAGGQEVKRGSCMNLAGPKSGFI